MPRLKRKVKKPTGKPQIQIDWGKVDRYLESGCTGTEIAGVFGCSPDTIYKRCEDEKGITFTAYSAQKKSSGDSLIKAAQMNLALKGNSSMLIWLGKNRLGQKDDPYQETAFNGTLSLALDELLKMKKSTDK